MTGEQTMVATITVVAITFLIIFLAVKKETAEQAQVLYNHKCTETEIYYFNGTRLLPTYTCEEDPR